MTVTEAHDAHAEGGHHESPQDRHKKEHMATWMFIGGDAIFFALEIFFWFYLRTLNTSGMWKGAQCSKSAPCTDGLGNNLTHPVAQASGLHTLLIAGIVILAAAAIWFAEVRSREGASRSVTTPLLGLGVLLVIGAIVYQFVQFQLLPFTTIDGTYASTFEFYMGSNVAHFLLLLTIAVGIFNRSRQGKYENGHYYQIHLSRLFGVWIAASTAVLALVATFFA